MKVKQAADQQWPGERMSSGEIGRRYTLAGVEALKGQSAKDQKRTQYQFQATLTVAGPEGEKPRHQD